MADKDKCDCGHESDEGKVCEDCNRLMCPECYEAHHLKYAHDANGKPMKAELFEAFGWFCDNCGHLNTIKMLREDVHEIELTESEEEKLRESLGLEPWETIPDPEELGGAFINVPSNVTCSHCRLLFETKMPPTLRDDIDLSDTTTDQEDSEDNDETDEDDFLV
jgi:hypothetical protein